MQCHARHRRPTNRNAASRTALTLAFTGATAAALPLISGGPAQASSSPGKQPVTRAAPTAATPARAASAAAPVEHLVRPGENLSEIAGLFHVPGGWPALYAANRRTVGTDPDLIRPGERLRIPVPAAAAPAPAAKPAATGTAYAYASASAAASASGTAKHRKPTAATTTAAPAPAQTPAPAPSAPTPVPAVPVSSQSTGPEGMPGNWTPVFDDEFNGDSLDTANWHTGWLGTGVTAPVGPEEQECYDPAQVSVGGGYLHLDAVARSEQCGGETRPYASGMVNTDGLHEFTSGAFEARIYLPAAPGGGIADWPAFWADGQSWPADGEMDVMEGLSGQTCFHYHDPAGGPGGCADVGPGWHVFGADWEGDTVTYYYDGHDVGSTTTDGSSAPQYLILNNAVGGSGGRSAPADMLVDYVRAWRQG